jgi:type II secretory pathway pseudopilin PulG
MRPARINLPIRQRGIATLLVAIVLLGVVSALTLASLGYGMQNRRAIDNETAQRIAREAAQAGLDEALQFFRARSPEYLIAWLSPAHSPHWERCAPDDRRVPCATISPAVRGNYLRLASALDMRSAFSDSDGTTGSQLITRIAGYSVQYDVYAMLCVIDTQRTERQCMPLDSPPVAGALLDPHAITLVARARVSGEHEPDELVAIAKETIAPSRGQGGNMLAVVPGSWSDAGRIGADGTYTEQ